MSLHTALRHSHSDGDMLDTRIGGIRGILGRILDPDQDGANSLVGTLVAHALQAHALAADCQVPIVL